MPGRSKRKVIFNLLGSLLISQYFAFLGAWFRKKIYSNFGVRDYVFPSQWSHFLAQVGKIYKHIWLIKVACQCKEGRLLSLVKLYAPVKQASKKEWNIPWNIPMEYSWNIPRNMKFQEMEYSRKIAPHDNVELFWNMEYSRKMLQQGKFSILWNMEYSGIF